jgi:hypothetical protein
MKPTNIILEAQNTVNQLEEKQKQHARKMWWQDNWYWVAGVTLIVGIGGYYTIKNKK